MVPDCMSAASGADGAAAARKTAAAGFCIKLAMRLAGESTATELVFENEALVTTMVRTQPSSEKEPYGVYPRPGTLVKGLSPTATRAEVGAFLSKPERVGGDFDRYEGNGCYLHFEFNANGRATRLTALLELV